MPEPLSKAEIAALRRPGVLPTMEIIDRLLANLDQKNEVIDGMKLAVEHALAKRDEALDRAGRSDLPCGYCSRDYPHSHSQAILIGPDEMPHPAGRSDAGLLDLIETHDKFAAHGTCTPLMGAVRAALAPATGSPSVKGIHYEEAE